MKSKNEFHGCHRVLIDKVMRGDVAVKAGLGPNLDQNQEGHVKAVSDDAIRAL